MISLLLYYVTVIVKKIRSRNEENLIYLMKLYLKLNAVKNTSVFLQMILS